MCIIAGVLNAPLKKGKTSAGESFTSQKRTNFLEFTFTKFPCWHTHVRNIVGEASITRGDVLGVAKFSEIIKGWS